MDPILQVQNLSFAYGNKTIFQNINLEVYPGDFLAIVGSNGTGKSTFLKTILGINPPTAGTIQWFGQPATRQGWPDLGYVAQGKTFNKQFPASVREMVTAGLIRQRNKYKLFPRDSKQKVDEVLKLVGLTDCSEALLGTLSGGQLQRALLARALVNSPQILVLDEPTVGIDPEGLTQICSLLNQLNKIHKFTIIMVTHQLECIASHINRLEVFEANGLVERNLHHHWEVG